MDLLGSTLSSFWYCRAVLVVFVLLCRERAVLDDERSFFTLSGLPAEVLRLAIGHPGVFLVAEHLAGHPQHQDIDAAIGSPVARSQAKSRSICTSCRYPD